ncbi:hypothetical protein LHYA1_G004176 [Lachnellula hyalina]|uniref:Rhodopsin domain-containing protein n=1 Tax=Lachnellula hyalina TaxID=1316788 RepID=A0A8H8R478_9HELO|nr:uncharacterized protein LHYA1_G004176 [Lachnellula hyalina]TVY27410.1 hypothetical protein LHYA1_G004176 [Lachnellula hyalina]
MQNRGPTLLALTIAFLVVTWVTVGLRCIVRVRIVKALGLDDYLIALAQVVFTALCICLILAVHYGTGRHNADVTAENAIEAIKYQTLAELFYIPETAIIKLSVGFLLLRITPNGAKVYRYIIFTSMIILSLWTIISFFIVLFQCYPVSYAWDQTSGKGTCKDAIVVVNAAYAFSAMDILFDWGFALLPLPMLWDIKMSLQVKMSLLLILGLGVFASTATIVRLKYVIELADVNDNLYSPSETLVWTLVETGLAIIAASIATLRPLFRRFHIPGFYGSGPHSNSHPRQRTTTGYIQSYDLGYIRNAETRTNTTHIRATSEGNTSQESILDHAKNKKEGISKQTDFVVSYETGPTPEEK